MTSFTNTPINYPVGADTPIRRVISTRDPVSNTLNMDNKNFKLGDEWLNKTTNTWWKLAALPQNTAIWERVSGSPGDVSILRGNDGLDVVPDANGVINVVGVAGQGITSARTGANTLSYTVQSATTAQIGVTQLATNAETIAGALATKANTPAGLAAKLGPQTNHTVMLGQGAAAALTASNAGTTGSVFVGATGADPTFSTTSASQFNSIQFHNANAGILSIYEDITAFTPVIAGSTAAGVGTYITQHGRYFRIGNFVHVEINIEWTAHTGTGDMLITGFPYVFAAATSIYPAPCVLQDIAFPVNTVWVCADGVNATTQAQLTASIDGGSIAAVQMSNAGFVFTAMSYFTG